MRGASEKGAQASPWGTTVRLPPSPASPRPGPHVPGWPCSHPGQVRRLCHPPGADPNAPADKQGSEREKGGFRQSRATPPSARVLQPERLVVREELQAENEFPPRLPPASSAPSCRGRGSTLRPEEGDQQRGGSRCSRKSAAAWGAAEDPAPGKESRPERKEGEILEDCGHPGREPSRQRETKPSGREGCAWHVLTRRPGGRAGGVQEGREGEARR